MAAITYGGGKTFQEIAGGVRQAAPANAIAAIEARAGQIMERRGITRAKATVIALQENPKAYKDYLAQNPKLDGGQTRDRVRAH